jgi:hypothetical protein
VEVLRESRMVIERHKGSFQEIRPDLDPRVSSVQSRDGAARLKYESNDKRSAGWHKDKMNPLECAPCVQKPLLRRPLRRHRRYPRIYGQQLNSELA